MLAALVAVLLAASGCGGGPPSLHLRAPRPAGRVATACGRVVAAAPDTLVGQSRRTLSPSTRYAAAWGDPPVVLRCGEPAPAALRPTSPCFVVDGVGWLATQHGQQASANGPVHGTLDFTTIGRSAYVEVSVPDAYQPAADALVDLARTVKAHTRVVKPCR